MPGQHVCTRAARARTRSACRHELSGWRGNAVPAKTPRAIIERLNREIIAALAQADIREKFQEFGIDARGGSPEDLRDLLVSEIAKWKQVVESTGIEKL